MTYFFRRIFFLFSAVLFFSCVSAGKAASSSDEVYVTDSKKISLLPPSCFERELDSLQQFTGTFSGRSFVSNFYITSSSEQVSVTILNEFGIETGFLVYDGTSCVLDSSLFPKALKCQYIVLDLENVYCTLESLTEHYSKAGLSFSETEEDGIKKRRIYDGSYLVEEITFSVSETSSVIVLNNFLRNYSYELTENL